MIVSPALAPQRSTVASGDAGAARSGLAWIFASRPEPGATTLGALDPGFTACAFGVALAILWLSLRVRPAAAFPGYAFGGFVALTAAARLVMEGVHGDSILWFGSLRAAQLVSLALLLAALIMLRRLALRASKPSP